MTVVLMAVLLCHILQAVTGVKNAACSYRTLDGHCCRLPFFYRNIKHARCTNLGDPSHRFWCPTDLRYNKHKGRSGWGYCRMKKSQCLMKTTDGRCCSFPFTYRGKEHTSCVAERSTADQHYWCATSTKFNKEVKFSGWGYCSGIKCHTCRSTKSWDQCNNKTATRRCPYKFKQCMTFHIEIPRSGVMMNSNYSNISTVFLKDCALDWKCSESQRRNRCSGIAHLNGTCSYECCHGDLCNSNKGSKGVDGTWLLVLVLVFPGLDRMKL